MVKQSTDFNAFLDYCFDRTQFDTTYRILCVKHRCDCLNCTDEEKENKEYVQIFLAADNHNFDQTIIHTCELRVIFPDKFIQYQEMLNIFRRVAEKHKYKMELYPVRNDSYNIITGRDIKKAKKCLSLVLKALFDYGTEKNFKNINDPLIFFDSIQSDSE